MYRTSIFGDMTVKSCFGASAYGGEMNSGAELMDHGLFRTRGVMFSL